ncbi:MAG: hypothetical protein ACPGRX_03600 [Bdellovibrionales bacterium]
MSLTRRRFLTAALNGAVSSAKNTAPVFGGFVTSINVVGSAVKAPEPGIKAEKSLVAAVPTSLVVGVISGYGRQKLSQLGLQPASRRQVLEAGFYSALTTGIVFVADFSGVFNENNVDASAAPVREKRHFSPYYIGAVAGVFGGVVAGTGGAIEGVYREAQKDDTPPSGPEFRP